MISLLFESINLHTGIYVSNLKHETEKATLATSGNNVKYLLDGMSYNYSIIIDKGERRKDYAGHIFRALMSRQD